MESADYCDNAINICPTADCLSLRPTATAYGRREEKKRGLCKEEQKCRCAEGSIRVRGVVGRSVGRGRKEGRGEDKKSSLLFHDGFSARLVNI